MEENTMEEIKIIKIDSPKAKPDENSLGFGKIFTDHMFVMDYHIDKGWYDPRIIPYGPFEVEPSLMVFHYGQAIFIRFCFRTINFYNLYFFHCILLHIKIYYFTNS